MIRRRSPPRPPATGRARSHRCASCADIRITRRNRLKHLGYEGAKILPKTPPRPLSHRGRLVASVLETCLHRPWLLRGLIPPRHWPSCHSEDQHHWRFRRAERAADDPCSKISSSAASSTLTPIAARPVPRCCRFGRDVGCSQARGDRRRALSP